MIHLPDILVITMRSTPLCSTRIAIFASETVWIQSDMSCTWGGWWNIGQTVCRKRTVWWCEGIFLEPGKGGTVLERTPMNRCAAKANFSKCRVMKNSSDTKRNQQKLEFWTKNLNRTWFRYFLIFKLHTNIPFKCSVFRRLLFFSASETRTLSDVSSHQF